MIVSPQPRATLAASVSSPSRQLRRPRYLSCFIHPYCYAVPVGVALVLFAPFLLQGRVLFSSTDSLFTHYPNLMFGYRSLRSGGFGLWNPYVFAGTDFTASMHHHFLNPVYWWLLAVPERYFFHAITAQVLIEFALIGILALQLFRSLFRSRIVALALAIGLQLSGFVWFTTTTFIGTLLAVQALASICVLVSMRRRTTLAKFVLLSTLLGSICLSGHLAYIIAFGLPVAIAAIILGLRCSPRDRVRFACVIAAAGATAVALGCVRLWPVIQDLLRNSTVTGAWLVEAPGSTAYMLVPGFIPGAWGYELSQTSKFMTSLGVIGRHGQFHNMLYIGVPMLALAYLAAAGVCGRHAKTCAILFGVFAATQTFGSQLIADTVQLVTLPLTHDIEFRVLMGVFGIAAPAVAIASLLRPGRLSSDRAVRMRGFLVCAFVVVAIALAGFAKYVHANPKDFLLPNVWSMTLQGLRIAVALSIITAVAIATARAEEHTLLPRVSNLAFAAGWIATLGIVAIALLEGAWSHRLAAKGIVYGVATIAWTTLTLHVSRSEGLGGRVRVHVGALRLVLSKSLVLGIYAAMLLLLLWPLPEGARERWGTFALNPAIELVKFVLLACAVSEVIHEWLVVRRSRLGFVLLLATLLIGDLLFFNKTFEYSGAPPFERLSTLYPGFAAPPVRRPSMDETRELLRDERFALIGTATGWSGGGRAPAFSVRREGDENLATIRNTADDYATLFQDVSLGADQTVTFGAWVKSDRPKLAGIMLDQASYHSGSGQWEYLTVVRRGGAPTARPTLFVQGAGEAQFAYPLLVEREEAAPRRIPTGAVAPPLSRPASVSDLDLVRYRANRPWILTQHPWGPVQASLNEEVYGIPTYGGVDSVVNPELASFMGDFIPVDEMWFTRAGIKPLVDDNRLLEILGVRYDFDDGGRLRERSNALARFSVFRNFEVIKDVHAAAARLRSAEFDPTTTVVLSTNPRGVTPGGAARFSAPRVETRGTGHIDVPVDAAQPGILLFNDVHADGWRAQVDGVPADVLRANGIFMAVAVPAGAKQVTFDFQPEPFATFAKVSASTGGALLVLAFLVVGRAAMTKRRSLARGTP